MKRILLATKLIATLTIICIIFTLDSIDLQTLRSNSKVLRFMSEFDRTEDAYFNFKNFDLLRVKWLEEHATSVYKNHSEARARLFHLLYTKARIKRRSGASGQESYESDGGRQITFEHKGGGNEDYQEIRIGESQNRIMLMRNKSPRSNLKIIRRSSKHQLPNPIDTSLVHFMHLSTPDTIELLKSFDLHLLNSVFETLIKQATTADSLRYTKMKLSNVNRSNGSQMSTPTASKNGYVLIDEISLTSEGLMFSVWREDTLPGLPPEIIVGRGQQETNLTSSGTDPNNGGTDPNTGGINPKFGGSIEHFRIPVNCETIVVPSMFFYNRFDNDVAKLLRDDKNKRLSISRLYG
ncbi:MAG: hypothetical protein EOP48_29880, partial [Sphingobacteriales bacterium]